MKGNMRTFKQYRTDAVAAIVAIGLLGAGVHMLARAAGAGAEVRAENLRRSAASSQADLMRRSLATLDARVAAARREAAAAQAEFRPVSELNSRLARLTEIAGAHGLVVDAVEPAAGVRGRYWSAPIHMAGRGTYRNAALFLHAVRGAMKDMTVASVDLSATGGDGASFRIDLTWTALPPGERAAASSDDIGGAGGIR